MALNACPHPPDMSSIETYVVVGSVWRNLDSNDSGVIWFEDANSAALVSVSAAMGICACMIGLVLKGRKVDEEELKRL